MASFQNAPHDHEFALVPYSPYIVSERLQLYLLKLVISLPAVDDALRLSIESYLSKAERRPIRVFERPRPAFQFLPKVFSLLPKQKRSTTTYYPLVPSTDALGLLRILLTTIPEASVDGPVDPYLSASGTSEHSLGRRDSEKQGHSADSIEQHLPSLAAHSSTALSAAIPPYDTNDPLPNAPQPTDLPPAYASPRSRVANSRPPLDSSGGHTFPDGAIISHGGTDYTLVGILGAGGSGRVFRTYTQEGEWFAMKIIHKPMAYRHPDGRRGILNEQRIWERVALGKRAFLMPLLKSWDDEENVYFLMPLYHQSLLHRLSEMNASQENHDMKLYAAEAVAALANLHALGIVHRDIKPENFLISPNGHLVLADYGLSWASRDANADMTGLGLNFFTGTAGYFAPEMLVAETVGYGCLADVWSLGISLLEVHLGRRVTLFHASSRSEVIAKMMSRDIPLHRVYDSGFQDLLCKMIVRDVNKRWSAAKLKEHPYFEGIDWEMLEEGYYRPDYRPATPTAVHPPSALRFTTFHRGIGIRDDLSVHLGSDGMILPNCAVLAQLELDRSERHTAFTFRHPFGAVSRILYDAPPRPPLPFRFRLRLDPPPAYVEDEDESDGDLGETAYTQEDDDFFSDEEENGANGCGNTPHGV